jgi:F0F1-type ATP synthase assembly protein I
VNPSFDRNLSTREADGLVLALELVLTTAIMAGLGFLLDRALGTVPVFTALFGAFTLAYEVWKIVKGYDLQMARHSDERTPLRRGTER